MAGSRLSAGGDILVVARVPEGATGEEATAAIAMTSVTLEAGGRIGMAAEGDVLIDGNTRRTLDDTRNSSGSNIDSTVTNSWVASSLSAQAITISGEDVTLVGAHLASPGVTRIAATGDLALDAGVDHRREHHLSTRSSGAFIDKLRVDETLSESMLAHPTHIAASQVQLVAGGDLDLYASQLVSREAAASLVAGGEVNLWAVEEQHYTLERHETSTHFLGWIPLERQAVSDSVFESGARVAHLQSEGAPTLAGGGDIRLQGSVIESPEAPVITPGVGPQAKADAQLILEGVVTRTVTEHHEEDTNIAWQRLAGHGSTVETLTLPQIQAGLSGVRAPGGIVAQIPEGDLNTHISQLSQQPGTAWVGELAAMGATDPVLWQPVALAYETWAYEQEGLSPAASVIIAIAVGYAVGPWISETIGSLAGSAYGSALAEGFAAGTVTTIGDIVAVHGSYATFMAGGLANTALSAGFTSIAGQATLALASNKGDIGATLDALGSSDTIRGAVSAMLSAGVSSSFSGTWNIERLAAQTVTGCIGNEIVGGSCKSGAGTAFVMGSLAWANHEMRQHEISNSQKFAGIVGTEDGHILSNDSGTSTGVEGDGVKLAGGRVEIAAICGDSNCLVDEETNSYILDNNGMIQFIGNGGYLEDYLTDHGELWSPMGGLQGYQGKFAFFEYTPGSTWDQIAEAYAGPHDMLNGSIWYDELGNIKSGTSETFIGKIGDITNYTNVLLATPFSISVMLPPGAMHWIPKSNKEKP